MSLPTASRACALLHALRAEIFSEHFPRGIDPILILTALLPDRPDVTDVLISSISELRCILLCDAHAMYDGDPAATSVDEVILCYPGIYALIAHRIAHILYLMKAPLHARMISELAHSRTGIDIHPGATVGEGLCIDHGTGIVIGETAEIGEGVSLYHGVTLGAKAFERDGQGSLIRGKKRHPTIKRGTTVYCGATVLGGDTVIGENCIIGARMLVTSSVPDGTVMTK